MKKMMRVCFPDFIFKECDWSFSSVTSPRVCSLKARNNEEKKQGNVGKDY